MVHDKENLITDKNVWVNFTTNFKSIILNIYTWKIERVVQFVSESIQLFQWEIVFKRELNVNFGVKILHKIVLYKI